MDDIKIIDLFFARSELAIEALDGKYGAICHNLSRSILKDQQDAEECVNDAYLGVWNAIPPHRPKFGQVTMLIRIIIIQIAAKLFQ